MNPWIGSRISSSNDTAVYIRRIKHETQRGKLNLARRTRPTKSPSLGTGFSQNPAAYFTAATLALRRDLYRAAVFLWITPFLTALSIMETVLPKAALAVLASPVPRLSRSLRSSVRRREVLERLFSVRLVVWRARFSAEK